MTPERLFSILNLVAIAGWLPLLFLPRFRWARTVVPVAIPIVLAVTYGAIVVTTFGRSEGGFSSLADVRTLFENQWALLRALRIDPPNPADDPVEMAVDAAATGRVDERLRAAGVSAAHPLVVLHVSAGNPFRR